MNFARSLSLALLAAVLIAAPAASQDSTAMKDAEVLKFQFTPAPGGDEIEVYLDILARETPATIISDPASPQLRGRKIELIGPVTLAKKDVFDWARSVLTFQRLILVPTGPRQANTWMVLDMNAPQITNHPEFVPQDELGEWTDRDGAYIVSTLTMTHLTDTSRARNALAQLSTRQVGRINDVPQTNSFIVADFAPVVVAMWKLLGKMDEEAGKIPPEEREKLDPRQPAEKPEPTLEREVEKYEQRLMGAQTSQAAQYFLQKILELNTRIEKEKAEQAAGK
jgi:hypothetical protein